MEMAGIFRKYWILLAALALALSCTKEQEGAEPVARGDYDPMVHFGLETYVGADEPATKTTYAGDDQTYVLNSVRYERINWNVDASDPYIDTVQVKSETEFTKNNAKTVDYKAVKIEGRTNKTGIKESEADTAPVSGNVDDNLYWSASKDDRYFYAVYPSPNMSGSKAENFNIDASTHTATVVGSISPNTSGAESDREQPYIKIIGTPGTPGSPASIEYLPDMSNAYMYAAAKVEGADAGYKKVPLRFKPLFSAVKLMITARDAGAKNYRLKKVELRTDLHCTDAYLRPGNPKGTALGGKFKAKFELDGSSTGDFTLIPPGSDPSEEVADTLQRLTINIPEGDRRLLEDKTVKVTFLTLPVEQKYLVVDYTFEYYDTLDAKWKDVRRFLTLQAPGKNNVNVFEDADWYTLQKARKLYVRSGIPQIQYFFEVQAQGNLPRTWDPSTSTMNTSGTHYLAENFYSVKSYRDSSGVKQPLKWEVIDYDEGGTGTFSPTVPTWLYLSKTQDDGTPVTSNLPGNKFVKYSFVEYDAGGTDNGPLNLFWGDPVSFTAKDLAGNYVHPDFYDDGTTPDPKAGESYAYDLSSHDIYGNPVVAKNGYLGTTANCYVVSAPGWYRFPAVYGNAIKGGVPNTASYYTGVDETTNPNLFRTFKNHLNNDIQGPWITKAVEDGGNGIVIDGVSILWDDADDLITSDDITKPFYKDDYIYFHVGHITNANAVITATSGGTVVWSWHIWAVANPETNLATTKIQQTLLNSSGGTFNYQSVYGDNGEFFQTMDLGQNDYEDTEVAPRFCDVRFVQKYKDKTIDTVTVRFRQSGIKDHTNVANALTYQWGRKDPFSSKSATVTCQTASVNNVAEAIMHPDILYRATASFSWSGNLRVDNLWNSKTDYVVDKFAFIVDGQSDGRQDKKVQKTIYDPCPPGFCVPNLFAFTAFNDKGLYETRTFREYCGTGYNDTTQQHRYTDFYTEYSSTAAGHRNSNGGTIRFYIRGRRAAGNTSNQDGSFDQPGSGNGNTGNYWLAEPACRANGEWSYGSAFHFNTISSDNTQGYMIYPVSGSDPDRAKWQRTHGLFVRPMKEQ